MRSVGSLSRGVVVVGAVAVCACAALLASCLPTDTRPPPATLHVTVSSDAALRDGFDTADGWHIAYTRFLMVLGNVAVSGDNCSNYSAGGGTGYTRIFDLRIAGPQKVTVVYGLGMCDFGFRVGNPNADSVLSTGVTEADKTFMRTPGTDAWATNRGISVYVEGTAKKGRVSKRFAWPFRQSTSSSKCTAGDGAAPGVTLQGNAVKTLDILIAGATLFADSLDPAMASTRFEPFARADDQNNADGEITFTELATIPQSMADVALPDAGVDAGMWSSLADDLYLGLLPRLSRFAHTGSCTLRNRMMQR